jgi:hypothetical protein
MDISHGSVVICYDPSVPTLVKYNLNHVYINSWAPFPCKPVFNGEFYPKFVINHQTQHILSPQIYHLRRYQASCKANRLNEGPSGKLHIPAKQANPGTRSRKGR